MSLDINWSLLTVPDAEAGPSTPSALPKSNFETEDPSRPSAETLTNHLISVLNTQLASTKRPSFIGPIEITNFDFGSTAPEVEIKDIRDVWRAFDEDDDDEEEDGEGGYDEEEILRDESEHGRDGQGYGYGYDSWRASGRSSELYQQQMGTGLVHSMVSPIDESSRIPSADWDDTASVFSDRRQSVHAVGLGARGLGGLGSPGLGYSHSHSHTNGHGHGHGPGHHPTASGLFSPGLGGVGLGAASVFSHPLSPGGPGSIRYHPPPTQHTYLSHPPSPARPPQIRPPTKINKQTSTSASSSIPSLQLHLNLTHTSDLTLTLLTSLIVNYPSSIFMSLPLKLSITGLQLAADLIVAFDGERKRIHLTILDDDHEPNGHGFHTSTTVGQRLLPEMRIDSEIGHSDAHVLRNVGKVERFIADVVRKTLVDELVFPNFHTIAL